jgi:ketosteroid isomerase-like protein
MTIIIAKKGSPMGPVGFFNVGLRRRGVGTGWTGWLVSLGAVLCVVWGAPSGAAAMTEEQARAAIEPWYRLFNLPVQGDMRKLQEEILTPDYQSCAGYLPAECWGRDTSIKVVGGFATSIPDLKFQIHEVLVAGDRVIVRGEVTGTPSGALFGAPHTGKSFRIMAIDIQTIRDGKISKTYHMENWLSALGQLRAQ